MMRTVVVGLVLAMVAPVSVGAQVARVRAVALYESYSFDPGLILGRVSEFTIPVGIDLRLGRFADVALSTGYASVELRSTDVGQLPHQTLSGMRDTDVRVGLNVVPGNLVAIVNAVIPTGVSRVQQEELAILGAISSDIIGFSAPTVGSGGSVGGGLVGAFPLGDFALGLGGTYRLPLAYRPVIGQTSDLKPGAEFRLRAGLEGPIARNTYVRVAGIYAARQKDQVSSVTQNGVGNRIIGYLAINQQFGGVAVTVYGFDVYRGVPQIEQGLTGAALLPRGNLLAFGSRVDISLGSSTVVAPRFEYRTSSAASGTTGPIVRNGDSFRFGANVRQQLSRSFAFVFQGSGATGSVVQAGTDIGFSGWRAGLHLELTP